MCKNRLKPAEALKLTNYPCSKQYFYKILQDLRETTFGGIGMVNKIFKNDANISEPCCKMVNDSNSEEEGGNDANLGINLQTALSMSSLSLRFGADDSWWSKLQHQKQRLRHQTLQ